ncbi:hypothetical protein I4U23_015207 [Adineta vaga]|nr:hypothetical protein I4U23_015207 [Adineta vaga]
MTVSSTEGIYLRSCHNGTIVSVTSFMSTSRKLDIAMIYLGCDLQRDFMFEISIDPSLLSSSSYPFADISALSQFPDEVEVLLPMGTMLQIQSSTTVWEKKNIYVKAQLYYEESDDVKQLKTFLLKQLPYGGDESFYISALVNILVQIGDYKRLEQVLKLRKPDARDDSDELYRSFICLTNLLQHSVSQDRCVPYVSNFLSLLIPCVQDLERYANLPNSLRGAISSLNKMITDCSSFVSFLDKADNLDELFNQLMTIVHVCEQTFSLLTSQLPASHPLFSQVLFIKTAIESLQHGHIEDLKKFETDHSSYIASSLQNDDNTFLTMNALLLSVGLRNNNGFSLQFLENLNKSAKPHAQILRQLARYQERHRDLPLAISYYRTVIEDCGLPPNSIEIVDAYSAIGSAFVKLHNTESALWNFRRARDLLLQHHPLTHPRLSTLQNLVLAEKFKQGVQQIYEKLDQYKYE